MKRYKMTDVHMGVEHWTEMKESSSGDWVRFEDCRRFENALSWFQLHTKLDHEPAVFRKLVTDVINKALEEKK